MSDAPPPASAFDRATAVVEVDAADPAERAFAATLDPGWWAGRGPNGGYLAALLLRAALVAVDDPARAPRSLTVHFARAPAEGPIDVVVRTERTGRSLSTLSVRATQGGTVAALALVACSVPWAPAFDWSDATFPTGVAAPDDLPRVPPDSGPALLANYDVRWGIGPIPYAAAEGVPAEAGGWIRFAGPPRPLDALALAAYADAWPPPVFGVVATPIAAPTVDLTVHFRAPITPPDGPPPPADAFVLSRFHTRLAVDGFLTEDGELWSADGRLLAESRQLALARRLRGA